VASRRAGGSGGAQLILSPESRGAVFDDRSPIYRQIVERIKTTCSMASVGNAATA
jgi:hypothetical protein